MENSKEKEEKGKTGLIPDEEIKGSDADKAYNENGDFGKVESEDDPTKNDVPPGADADS